MAGAVSARPRGNLLAAAILLLVAGGAVVGLWLYLDTHAPEGCFAAAYEQIPAIGGIGEFLGGFPSAWGDWGAAFADCTSQALAGGWMAWTWQTLVFFVVIFLILILMSVWELISPGGAPRAGIFGITTTRGDRLFITLLGSAWLLILSLVFGTLFIVLVLGLWLALVFWKG